MRTNYPDLKIDNDFWNRVQVPSFWYNMLKLTYKESK